MPLRPTRDIDLLGFGTAEIPHLIKVFEDLCAIEVEDGINFDPASIKAEEIRKDANYSSPNSVDNFLLKNDCTGNQIKKSLFLLGTAALQRLLI